MTGPIFIRSWYSITSELVLSGQETSEGVLISMEIMGGSSSRADGQGLYVAGLDVDDLVLVLDYA